MSLSRSAGRNPIAGAAGHRPATGANEPRDSGPCASSPSDPDADGRSPDERQALRELLIAAANQLELWTRGQTCDDFRREYLIELVSELRAEASDVLINQSSLWADDEQSDERRRLVADLAEEQRTRVPAGRGPTLGGGDPTGPA
ncbi:hypothetical protein [Mycobacterium sp. ACS4331]|uniref:hypothetical protein n=1 Tax=Mycobacterium sp. ACS4331 TaxID=1834121 RepID=UPI0007FFF212|nr:hypothetical protein [Mycobacterium sp. ACS4331]OBF29222.1 hypothetical protein A5727_24635 [Mycobacterium sp. ACS4331]